jgi:endonuclease/exonuclease/phosphatase family metal-dependent hydrolase
MKIFLLIKKYSYKIAVILNIAMVFLLILSYLSAFISPIYFYPLAFLGLIYPFLLIINLIFTLFWIFRKSKLLLISLIAIILGYSFIVRVFQITIFKNENISKTEKIKVLSYNVRVFNLWKWTSERNSPNKIFDFIRKSNAEIVCIQEFYSKEEKGKNAHDSILKNSVLKNSHVSYTSRLNRKSNVGIATFTSFPIVGKGKVSLAQDDNFCIYTDILINNDTVRVLNIHLESIHLGHDDYYLLENFEKNDSINVDGIKSIFYKFKKSYKKRALQVIPIAKHIKECKYPIILCGDFNDTPVSYVYQQLSNKLDDAFRQSGNGIGYTFVNRYRTFRIDYILHSSVLKSFDFKVTHLRYSDHYPIECSFNFNH